MTKSEASKAAWSDADEGTANPAAALEPQRLEQAGYLNFSGQQIYYVLHPAGDTCRGRVVLAGPFAAERSHVYIPWVRWARCLAAHGWEALRFDYRGMGESTGDFQEMTLEHWLADLTAVAQWLGRRERPAPLALCGLGLGALLAAKAFAAGLGQAALLWSPPRSAQQMLRDALRARLASDLALGCAGRADYIAQLKAGQSVSVEGHAWSAALWRSAVGWDGPLLAREDQGAATGGAGARLWKTVDLEETEAACLVNRTRLWRSAPNSGGSGDSGGSGANAGLWPAPLNPRLNEFFNANLAWLCHALTDSGSTHVSGGGT